jgi:hypothetical protein
MGSWVACRLIERDFPVVCGDDRQGEYTLRGPTW